MMPAMLGSSDEEGQGTRKKRRLECPASPETIFAPQWATDCELQTSQAGLCAQSTWSFPRTESTPSNKQAKGKPAVIDLTQDDDSEPEIVEVRSLKRHCSNKAEQSNPDTAQTDHEEMLESCVKKMRKRTPAVEESDDASLALARRLQAEFDGEYQLASGSGGDAYSTGHGSPSKGFDSILHPDGAGIEAADKASLDLAKRLQAQFDAEASWGDLAHSDQLDGSSKGRGQTGTTSDSYAACAEILQEYTASLLRAKCHQCDALLLQADSTSLEGTLSQVGLASKLTCSRCSQNTCVGCGAAYSLDEASDAGDANICCDNGRLFMVWGLLSRFDQGTRTIPNGNKSNKSKPRSTASSTRRKKPSGSGYGGPRVLQDRHGSGTGYGDSVPSNTCQSAAVVNTADCLTKDTIKALSTLLPSLDRATSFDFNPPESLCAMLRCSSLPDKIAELLRNDSLEDITNRGPLYHKVFDLVQAFSSHFALVGLIHQARFDKLEDVDFLTLSLGSKKRARSKDESTTETNSSIASCIRSLILQSKTIIEKAKTDEGEFLTDEGQDMLLSCQRLLETEQYLAMSVPHDSTTGPPSYTESEESWHQMECMRDCDDEAMFSDHSFAGEARAITQPPFGRMKRLIEEIATLQTSLPPGIFVRHASSRLDVLKVLIIGPAKTPYADGLFEFDVFCPQKYPQDPPKVTFRTTGGGRAHFNPNLYQNGYVCLSLINTWSGERWSPGKSTLLQVLVSIQSMIFCDEPWYNEPGRESRVGQGNTSAQSEAYNKGIQALTARHAMLEWLKKYTGIWTDFVKQYFCRRGDAVLATVSNWAQGNQQMSNTLQNDLAKAVHKIRMG